MKTIKILGQEVKIAFNLATQIAYERIKKEPFNIEALNNMESAVVLYAACIIANNEKTTITIDMLDAEGKVSPLNFVAQGEVVIFDGFLQVYRESSDL